MNSFENNISSQEPKIINLSSFRSHIDVVKFIYQFYHQTPLVSVEAFFQGDVDFQLQVCYSWITISIYRAKPGMYELICSFKPSIFGSRSTFMFHRRLCIDDLKVICSLLEFQDDLKQVDIRSHNIVLKRFRPERLKYLCLDVIKKKGVRNTLSKGVSERLGLS